MGVLGTPGLFLALPLVALGVNEGVVFLSLEEVCAAFTGDDL